MKKAFLTSLVAGMLFAGAVAHAELVSSTGEMQPNVNPQERASLQATRSQYWGRQDAQSNITTNYRPSRIGRTMTKWYGKADPTHYNMEARDFTNQHLARGRFNHAFLMRARFQQAILTETQFKGADLTGADFTGAHMMGTDLKGANLREANLSGADLSNAKLENAYLENARYNKFTLFPAKFVPEKHGMVFVP